MKILLGYSYYRYPDDVKTKVESFCKRLRDKGMDIHAIPLTINPPGGRLSWVELEEKWKRRDKDLMDLYQGILAELDKGYDILVNWNGINLHPEFIQDLKVFTVYGCFDDPESSEDLSKPVAAAYDLCMVGNIAEISTYRTWGVKEVRFWPMGFFDNEYDPTLTTERILNGDRDVDITMLCERESPWRKERLNKVATAFPMGEFYGQGWAKGFLEEKDKIPLYQRTKVGPNIHNSTGPINYRTYMLPANGVMQVCDNKSNLGKIFELNKEVVGFNTIEECIDLCRYYLAHDEERRKIAAAGFERVLRDYNEFEVFKMIERYVNEVLEKRSKRNILQRVLDKFKK